MIEIHHLLVSQSERVIWLMEELGLPYELQSYPRDPQTGMAHPVFSQLHPVGQAPVIKDGDVTLAESTAIFTYILDLYGDSRLRIAPGAPNYPDFVYWYNYANGGLMPQAMQHLIAARFDADEQSVRRRMVQQRFGRHLGMMNDRLAENEWLAGSIFTAADILCHFPFGTMSAFAKVDITPYPNIRRWLDRISARPAYQTAMTQAGHATDPAAAA